MRTPTGYFGLYPAHQLLSSRFPFEAMFLWPDALPDANPFSRFLRHAGIRYTYSNRGTHREGVSDSRIVRNEEGVEEREEEEREKRDKRRGRKEKRKRRRKERGEREGEKREQEEREERARINKYQNMETSEMKKRLVVLQKITQLTEEENKSQNHRKRSVDENNME